MMKLHLSPRKEGSLVVLCLGAHSDDIEIGCGGTLLYLRQLVPEATFHWVVFSAAGKRGEEAMQGAELFVGRGKTRIVLKEYRDGFLPYHGTEIKVFFEEMKTQANPDLIFTHWQGDAHQDHRLISELTWNTFRDHLIWEYEIPKYDGDLGRPNMFVALEARLYEHKVDNILQAFESQRSKPWFGRETLLGLMRIRGVEANSPSGYAEAFHARKLTIVAP